MDQRGIQLHPAQPHSMVDHVREKTSRNLTVEVAAVAPLRRQLQCLLPLCTAGSPWKPTDAEEEQPAVSKPVILTVKDHL